MFYLSLWVKFKGRLDTKKYALRRIVTLWIRFKFCSDAVTFMSLFSSYISVKTILFYNVSGLTVCMKKIRPMSKDNNAL